MRGAFFDVRLGTISQALNWKSETGQVLSYEPYLREMRIWADLFREVHVFAPLSSKPIQINVAEYGRPNFLFTFVNYNNTPKWWGFSVRLVQLPVVLVKLWKFIAQHEVLLIRSPSHLGLFAHLIALVQQRPTITKYAGYFGAFEGERIPSIVERLLIKYALHPPHYAMVYGRTSKEHLTSFIPAIISRSEIAVIREAPRKRLTEDLTMFSLGKLMPVKNYMLIIEALGLLKDECPDLKWTYYVIGDGPERARMVTRTTELQLEDKVIFLGKLGYLEALRKIACGDLLIMPGTKEGWPKVIADAWAAGCVPVAAAAGLVPEIIQDGVNGFLFEPTPEGLKKKLKIISDREDQLQVIKEKTSEFCDSVTMEEFERRVIELCETKLQLKRTRISH